MSPERVSVGEEGEGHSKKGAGWESRRVLPSTRI